MGLLSVYRAVSSDGEMTDGRLRAFCDRLGEQLPGLELSTDLLMTALGSLTESQREAVLNATSDAGVEFCVATGCGAGDPKALRLLEDRYLTRLPKMIAHMNLGEDREEEVVQEVRRKLLVGQPPKIAEYAGKGSLLGLLKVTATRTAISMIRKEQRVSPGQEPVLDPAGSLDEEAMFLKTQYRDAFKQAFESAVVGLTRHERNLLRLHFLGRVTLPQLAKMYGVHRATIVRRLKDIRLKVEKSTRTELTSALKVNKSELDSVMDLIKSRLDASVERVLATMDEEPAPESKDDS